MTSLLKLRTNIVISNEYGKSFTQKAVYYSRVVDSSRALSILFIDILENRIYIFFIYILTMLFYILIMCNKASELHYPVPLYTYIIYRPVIYIFKKII